MMAIPNIIAPDVPVGKDDSENVELKRGVNALEARSDTSIDYADIRVL